MKEVKPYVTIQSSTTIQVTCGLQNQDVTNPDAHVPDRLKISPSWPNYSIIILQGKHEYPSEIVEWPTVKALEKDGILTIGSYLDSTNDEKALANKEKLSGYVAEIAPKKAEPKTEEIKIETKTNRLADIANEEE